MNRLYLPWDALPRCGGGIITATMDDFAVSRITDYVGNADAFPSLRSWDFY